MDWRQIEVSDNNSFALNGELLFGKVYEEVLKFHSPGIAPVKDETGWYHINTNGVEISKKRYQRAFGYYFNKSSVVNYSLWFHIDTKGNRFYTENYSWTGNYQESVCSVRNLNNEYFHIDINGNELYKSKYVFVGDFKDGYACIRLVNGFYKHINKRGEFINNKEFLDLGVFHKNFAIARDRKGWFHIDKLGNELYEERYFMIEPFYNGYAVVDTLNNKKQIINEKGIVTLKM